MKIKASQFPINCSETDWIESEQGDEVNGFIISWRLPFLLVLNDIKGMYNG